MYVFAMLATFTALEAHKNKLYNLNDELLIFAYLNIKMYSTEFTKYAAFEQI